MQWIMVHVGLGLGFRTEGIKAERRRSLRCQLGAGALSSHQHLCPYVKHGRTYFASPKAYMLLKTQRVHVGAYKCIPRAQKGSNILTLGSKHVLYMSTWTLWESTDRPLQLGTVIVCAWD